METAIHEWPTEALQVIADRNDRVRELEGAIDAVLLAHEALVEAIGNSETDEANVCVDSLDKAFNHLRAVR